MRFTLVFAIIVLLFAACKKDKFTTAPQITFKSYNPNQGSNYSNSTNEPVMTLEITDAEGDLKLYCRLRYCQDIYKKPANQ
ncbi:MAG: hypothetical protein R2765_08070 [Ferruginibacter sp.]